MAILGKYVKQPAETESYTISYADDLTDGDELVAATAVCIPDGTLEVVSVFHTDTNARVWLRGGQDREKYKIEMTVRTGAGRVLQDEFFVTITDY